MYNSIRELLHKHVSRCVLDFSQIQNTINAQQCDTYAEYNLLTCCVRFSHQLYTRRRHHQARPRHHMGRLQKLLHHRSHLRRRPRWGHAPHRPQQQLLSRRQRARIVLNLICWTQIHSIRCPPHMFIVACMLCDSVNVVILKPISIMYHRGRAHDKC